MIFAFVGPISPSSSDSSPSPTFCVDSVLIRVGLKRFRRDDVEVAELEAEMPFWILKNAKLAVNWRGGNREVERQTFSQKCLSNSKISRNSKNWTNFVELPSHLWLLLLAIAAVISIILIRMICFHFELINFFLIIVHSVNLILRQSCQPKNSMWNTILKIKIMPGNVFEKSFGVVGCEHCRWMEETLLEIENIKTNAGHIHIVYLKFTFII